MSRTWLSGVVVLAFAVGGCASDAADDAAADASVEVRSLGSFIGRHMGRTDESIAWNRLLERADASERFVDVVERGNAVGAVYGLSGLWLVDLEAHAASWKTVARKLAEHEGAVFFHRGCIAEEIPARAVIGRIVDGTIPGGAARGRACRGAVTVPVGFTGSAPAASRSS